jgi:hypothetical protein
MSEGSGPPVRDGQAVVPHVMSFLGAAQLRAAAFLRESKTRFHRGAHIMWAVDQCLTPEERRFYNRRVVGTIEARRWWFCLLCMAGYPLEDRRAVLYEADGWWVAEGRPNPHGSDA